MLTKKICFISPWPPHEGGVAIHSYDLIGELIKHYPSVTITVITVCEKPKPLPGIKIISALNESDLPDFTQFYKIIHVMTNNLHVNISLDLLPKIGGVVLLHEINLHGLINFNCRMYGQGFKWDSFKFADELQPLNKWKLLRFFTKAIVNKFGFIWLVKNIRIKKNFHALLFEKMHYMDIITRYAEHIICFSKANKQSIHALTRYPLSQIYVETLAFNFEPSLARQTLEPTKKQFIFGLFGFEGPWKHYHAVIRAFDVFLKQVKQPIPIALHIVGKVSEATCHLVEKLGLSERVKIEDNPSDEEWNKQLDSIDCLIAMRFPTLGEASGPVTQAARRGIISIVNEIGWFESLPNEWAYKVRVPITESCLVNAMKQAYQNGDLIVLQKRRDLIQNQARRELSMEKTAKSFAVSLKLEKKQQERTSNQDFAGIK